METEEAYQADIKESEDGEDSLDQQIKEEIKNEQTLKEKLVLKDNQYKQLYRELKEIQDKIWLYIKSEHESQTISADRAIINEYEQLRNLLKTKQDKIESLELEEGQKKINDNDNKQEYAYLIQLRQKYGDFVKENEHSRKYIESESFRSANDLSHGYRMLYEDLMLEVERKKIYKEKLEEEKQKYEAAMLELRREIQDAKSKEHKLVEELENLKNY